MRLHIYMSEGFNNGDGGHIPVQSLVHFWNQGFPMGIPVSWPLGEDGLKVIHFDSLTSKARE
jgi:hypothetical protein